MWTQLKAQFLRRQSIGTIIIGVTGAVLALQWSGTLQLLESAVLDRWFRLRPLETGESRVVIVTIDEPDISRLGSWPMSDATLAKLLEKQGVAYDIAPYRSAPPGLRIWGGATVETADIEALLPWLDWAYATLKAELAPVA